MLLYITRLELPQYKKDLEQGWPTLGFGGGGCFSTRLPEFLVSILDRPSLPG